MDIDLRIKNNREFYKSGKTIDISFRKEALMKLEKCIYKYENELAKAVYNDFGKPEMEVFLTEIELVKSEISLMMKNLDKWIKPEVKRMDLTNPFSKNMLYKQPYGVVLIISPWNYPIQLSMIPLIGSIASGNCSILKLSEHSPNTSKLISKMIGSIYPDEYVSVYTDDIEESKKLVSSNIDYIFYTGSPKVGAEIASEAGRRLIPYTLELGGKSPCIVDKTADIDLAARKIVWGKFINAGQTCVAPDYIIAEESIYTEFIEKVKLYINKFYGENPIESNDYSAIINDKSFDRIKSLIDDKTIIYGGRWCREERKIEPTLLLVEDLKEDIMQEEIFGPILPILTYKSINDIEEIIEHNINPLALYIFSKDKKINARIINHVSFGGGCINDTIMHCSTSRIPFGGVGKSGIGKYHGEYSIDTFSHQKSVVISNEKFEIKFKYPPYSIKKLRLIKKMMNIIRNLTA